MATAVDYLTELKYDRLSVVPLGGQGEIGQVLWAFSYNGEIMLVDAGACYPPTDLPGVDLLLPNTNFLVANQERITALLLTNGHEEHCGAVGYLLDRVKIPRILAPQFVCELIKQNLHSRLSGKTLDTVIDTIESGRMYKIGAFDVEWIRVNDAIADACALRINTVEGVIVYTSSFKLDQTPVDSRHMDVARLAQAGDSGVTLLISDSAGAEQPGYSASEKAVFNGFARHIANAEGRCVVVMNGTNTHRLQMLFDLAKRNQRKVILYGDTLIQTAVAAVITGNLNYDRSIEASLADLDRLPDEQVLIVATGDDGDALVAFHELAYGKRPDLTLKKTDVMLYSAVINPGQSRRMAMILDQLLSLGIKSVVGSREGIHVSNHASQEELKLMLAITKPRIFVPAIGEGRQIMHHAQLADAVGSATENIFPLRNGQVLEINKGVATRAGAIESEAVFFNRNQAESVTRFSVNERRSLSTEGVLTIACLLDAGGKLAQPPVLESAALGFIHSRDWEVAWTDLCANITELIERQAEGELDLIALRTAVRDLASKTIRSKMQCKPTIQVVIHQLQTASAG